MVFDSFSAGEFFLKSALAEFAGENLGNMKFTLSENVGTGYIRFLQLSPLIRLMITQSEFNEDLLLKKNGLPETEKKIVFSFRNIFHTSDARLLPCVQISSSDIDVEVFIPAKTKINTILIIVDADLLHGLLNHEVESQIFRNIIAGDKPYFYDQLISPEIQRVAANIVEMNVPESLRNFYLKVKAEELICLFFVELLKRQDIGNYSLNISDVKAMYLIRDKIASDLSVQPNLTELTVISNMSESKMNRLFRQIFGNSIYKYYQVLRMNEAAYLIKEKKFSVSEAGYHLGFTNMSHFTRLFEKHLGLKPKKYSSSS